MSCNNWETSNHWFNEKQNYDPDFVVPFVGALVLLAPEDVELGGVEADAELLVLLDPEVVWPEGVEPNEELPGLFDPEGGGPEGAEPDVELPELLVPEGGGPEGAEPDVELLELLDPEVDETEEDVEEPGELFEPPWLLLDVVEPFPVDEFVEPEEPDPGVEPEKGAVDPPKYWLLLKLPDELVRK